MGDILLIDDDPSIHVALKLTCRLAGLPLRCVYSLKQAQAAMRTAWPSLVLIDLDLGEVDGWQVWEALRLMAAADQQPLRVGLFTAVLDSQDQARAKQAGAVIVLSKGTDPKVFVKHMRRILSEGDA